MNNWKEYFKYDNTYGDPLLIKLYKNIRKFFRVYKKIIIMMVVLSIISFCFISYIEPLIKNHISLKIIFMVLNFITFIGVFYPISIQKNITKNDIKDTIKEEKEKDKRDKQHEELTTFG